MLFGVVVPEIVGVVVTVALLVGDRITMVGGAMAVKPTVAEVLPAALVAVTVRVFGPAGTVTVHENVPETEAVVVQSVTGPGPVITTVLPGVAVPEMVGVVVVSGPVGFTNSDGGLGTTVNVVGTLTVPAGFEAVTVRVFGPAGSVVLSAQENVPETEAVVVQSVTGPGPVITTVLPGVAVPETVGVVVVAIFTGDVTVSVGGAMAVKLATAGVDTPPRLPEMAVTLAGPAANVRLAQA